MASTLIAQITDPHIVANARLCLNQIDTASFLRVAVETIRDLPTPPDAVLVTGDLVNDGRANQYEHLRILLAPLSMPVLLMPGNHDNRSALRAAFPHHRELGSGDTCDFVLTVGSLRVIGLDTLVEGEEGGDLSERQLDWFARTLGAQPNAPTLVAMHHPPFRTGIAHMDALGLAESAAAALEQIIRANPQVERVTCGHLHRTISRRWAGTVVATVPSVAHAVALDLRDDSHAAWNYEPPFVTLHHWNGTALVTHQVACGEFPSRRYGP